MRRRYEYEDIIEDPSLHTEKIGTELLHKYLDEHKNDKYDITIEGREFHIPIKFLINFIIADEKVYDRLCHVYDPPYYRLTLEFFKYAILSYFNEKMADSPELYDEIVKKRLNKLGIDAKVKLVNKYYQTNDPFLSKIQINPELKEAVLKELPYHKTNLYKAIYVYIKLCKLLTYDDDFFASNESGDAATMHQDINYISKITPTNNKIVCYEFASIYEALLKEIGIPSCIEGVKNYDTYGKEHIFVKFKADGHLITADSTTSILGGDLFSAKLNLGLSGFKSANYYSIEYLYKSIADAFEDIHESEPSNIPMPRNLDIYMEEYETNTESIHDVSISDRLDILINKANDVKLKGLDCLAYLLYLRGQLFPGDMKMNVNISLVRDDTDKKTTSRAIFTIKGIDENNQEHINYFSYLPNQQLTPISLEELQTMFDNNKLGYISTRDGHSIQGIKVR